MFSLKSSLGGGADHIQGGFLSSIHRLWKYQRERDLEVCLLGTSKPSQVDKLNHLIVMFVHTRDFLILIVHIA